MTIRQTKQILVSLLAVMSLFVSAVSACACSHHSTGETTEAAVSCHGATHSDEHKTASAEKKPSGANIGVDCNCFVRVPVPAVSAKADSKKLNQSDTPACDDPVRFEIPRPEYIASLTVSFVSSEPSAYSFQPGRLASSRAPPRL